MKDFWLALAVTFAALVLLAVADYLAGNCMVFLLAPHNVPVLQCAFNL